MQKSLTPPYRWISHTADAGAVVYGRSLRALFQRATLMFCALVSTPRAVRPRISRKIRLRADDIEMLFAHYLKELLYRFDTRRFLPRRLVVEKISERELSGLLWGEKFEAARHPLKTEVKAVTYHQLAVKRRGGAWRARVIFDL